MCANTKAYARGTTTPGRDSTLRVATFLDKGGVGKTTSAAHLGVALGRLDKRVCIIDLAGKQNDLAKHFGLYEEVQEADRWPHIGQAFDTEWPDLVRRLGGREAALEDMTWETEEGIDIIPSSKTLDSADAELASLPVEKRYALLDTFLTDYLEPTENYDIIVVDLPGLTNNIVMNGLWAARNVVAPVEMGAFEEVQMDVLLDDLETLAETYGVETTLTMVLPNRVDPNTKVGRNVLATLNERFPNEVAPEPIPQTQDIRNAQAAGRTLFGLHESVLLSTGERAASAYENNAVALLNRLERNGVQ